VSFYPFQPGGSAALGGYVVPPSGQPNGNTDTANINAVVQAGAAAYLLPGTYYVKNLLLDSLGALLGSGPSTVLQPVAGTTGYVIALKTPATTRQVNIRDLTINCNQVCGGISLDNTGFTPNISFVPFDPLHVLDNVFVLAAAGDAFHFDNNMRELRVSKCKQYFATGYGFYLGPGAGASGTGCTDSHFTDCTSGQSGNHGYYLAAGSGNNMFTSCKSFFAGFNEATSTWGTTQCGFEVLSSDTVFAGCSAQQAALHGFDLQGASFISMAGCEADTNSAGASVTTGVGINTNGVVNSSITGCTGGNNAGLSPGSQLYGLQVAGTQTGLMLYGNSVTGVNGLFHYVSGFGFQVISFEQVGSWQANLFQSPSLTYNAQAVQPLANGSTIALGSGDGSNFGLYPVSETANVTGIILAVPANGAGTTITVVNESAFTVTFAASGTSHVADGVSDVIPAQAARTFTYDGNTALWYRTG
jgi:hypothetical protein